MAGANSSMWVIILVAALAWGACVLQAVRIVRARSQLRAMQADASIDAETGLIAATQFPGRVVATHRRISRMAGEAQVQILHFASSADTRAAGQAYCSMLRFPDAGFRLDDCSIGLIRFASQLVESAPSSHIPEPIAHTRFEITQAVDRYQVEEFLAGTLEVAA